MLLYDQCASSSSIWSLYPLRVNKYQSSFPYIVVTSICKPIFINTHWGTILFSLYFSHQGFIMRGTGETPPPSSPLLPLILYKRKWWFKITRRKQTNLVGFSPHWFKKLHASSKYLGLAAVVQLFISPTTAPEAGHTMSTKIFFLGEGVPLACMLCRLTNQIAFYLQACVSIQLLYPKADPGGRGVAKAKGAIATHTCSTNLPNRPTSQVA